MAFGGPERVWCGRCWRLVGVQLGGRVVAFLGTAIGLMPRSRRCAAGVVVCRLCSEGLETTGLMAEAVELAEYGPATELLRRGLLDRIAGGPLTRLSAEGSVAVVNAGRVGGGPYYVVASEPPRPELLGAMVFVGDGRVVRHRARLAAYIDGERCVGQPPGWWQGERPHPAARLWLLDRVERIDAFAWGSAPVMGDPLRSVVERLRDPRRAMAPLWLRWWRGQRIAPRLGEGDAAGLGTLADACRAASALRGGSVDDPRLARPLTAWAALRRRTLGRDDVAPAPYPIGPAPAGRYIVAGPDGPAHFEHPGGPAMVVWLARCLRSDAPEAS